MILDTETEKIFTPFNISNAEFYIALEKITT